MPGQINIMLLYAHNQLYIKSRSPALVKSETGLRSCFCRMLLMSHGALSVSDHHPVKEAE